MKYRSAQSVLNKDLTDSASLRKKASIFSFSFVETIFVYFRFIITAFIIYYFWGFLQFKVIFYIEKWVKIS